MKLTRQQTETIFKVCNLLDCEAHTYPDVNNDLNEVVFKKDDIMYVGVRYMPVAECWVGEYGYYKGIKIKGKDFPTFEQLKPILDLIPIN